MSTAVTTETFESEVLQSDKPVIVDFWAEWGGPCHAVSPVLDKIAEERNDELRLVKVNIDEEPALAQKYGIVSIPTIILFRGGEPAAAAIGAQPKGAIETALGLADGGITPLSPQDAAALLAGGVAADEDDLQGARLGRPLLVADGRLGDPGDVLLAAVGRQGVELGVHRVEVGRGRADGH